jgi:hypothetical protein
MSDNDKGSSRKRKHDETEIEADLSKEPKIVFRAPRTYRRERKVQELKLQELQ